MAKTSASKGGTGKGRSDASGRRGAPAPVPPGGQRVGFRRFVRESWGELRKVQWPTRQQVAQGTLVVGVVTAFFAIYLTGIDYLAIRIVRAIDHLLT